MHKIRYQVFISSTYEDLRAEREQVIKSILEMGHFPVGMEMFSAADEEQWKLITRQIDECDYYVVICAHRYGSQDTTTGTSFTEKEYDYAVKRGVPTLGFVIELSAKWPTEFVDTAPELKSALDSFKEKIKKKYISYWTSAEDLYGKVTIALMKQMTASPQIGWVRTDSIVGSADTVAELGRLSKENAQLRKEIEEREERIEKAQYQEIEDTLKILNVNEVKINFWYKSGTQWEDEKSLPLAKIFNMIAPEFMIEKSSRDTQTYIAHMLNYAKRTSLRPQNPIPRNTLQGILADLVTLDLVMPSARKHSASDASEYWCLTEKGREVLKHLRRKRLEAGLRATELPDQDQE